MTEQRGAGEAVVGTILVGCGNRGVNAHGRLATQSPVLVATSAPWHVPVALAAVRAGKHVLVEKPLADTAAAARDLVQAAAQAGVVGLVGYQWRLSAFTAALVREAAALDPMQALVTRQRGPFRPQFFFPAHYGGIMDHLAHDIHLALLLMGGAPTGVSASVTRGLIRHDETLECANVLVEFEGGRRSATIIGSMHGIRTPNIVQVVGRYGSVTTTDRQTLQVVRHGGITAPLPAQPAGLETTLVDTGGDGGDATGAMLAHFADLIAGRTTEQRGTTLREGMDAVAVMEAAVEAARSGRRVPIDPAEEAGRNAIPV
jgi:predicted dehydrogenase